MQSVGVGVGVGGAGLIFWVVLAVNVTRDPRPYSKSGIMEIRFANSKKPTSLHYLINHKSNLRSGALLLATVDVFTSTTRIDPFSASRPHIASVVQAHRRVRGSVGHLLRRRRAPRQVPASTKCRA